MLAVHPVGRFQHERCDSPNQGSRGLPRSPSSCGSKPPQEMTPRRAAVPGAKLRVWVLMVLLTMRCLGESLLCIILAVDDHSAGSGISSADVELLFVLVLFEDGQGLFTALLVGIPPGLIDELQSAWASLSALAARCCSCIEQRRGVPQESSSVSCASPHTIVNIKEWYAI